MTNNLAANTGVRTERAHISPAQAAKLARANRTTVVRAVKAGKIEGFLDNHNNWRLYEESVRAWADARSAQSVRSLSDAHPETQRIAPNEQTLAQAVEIAELRVKLETTVEGFARERELLREQIEKAEEERDFWRTEAQKSPRWAFWRRG